MPSSELTTLFPPYWGGGGEMGALGHSLFDRIYSLILSWNRQPLQVPIFLHWLQMVSTLAALHFNLNTFSQMNAVLGLEFSSYMITLKHQYLGVR